MTMTAIIDQLYLYFDLSSTRKARRRRRREKEGGEGKGGEQEWSRN